MKRPSKELKRIARDMLNNRYNIPMIVFIIFSLVPTVIGIPFSLNVSTAITPTQLIVSLLAEYLILLITQLLGIGVVYVHLNMTRGWEHKISQILYPFRNGTDRFLGGAFLISLAALICGLPLAGGILYFYFTDITGVSIGILAACSIVTVVLGTLYSLNYYYVLYFLLDYPQMKVLDAFKESRRMMKGNKGRLLYIQCSYFGWSILTFLSLGLVSLWVEPYFSQIMVIFYLDCTGELDLIPVREYDTDAGYQM